MNSKQSLANISKIILKNLIIIVIFMILGGGCAGLYAKHKQTTSYSARTNIVIGHNLDRNNYRNSTVMSDLNMMDTYEDQIKDPQVMRKAHSLLPKKLRYRYNVSDLTKDTHTSSEDHSLVMEIRVTTDNPNASTKIANSVAHAFKDEFRSMNPSSAEVKLLAPARKSDAVSRTSPSAKKYAVLGAALGALIGMLIAFGWTSYKKIN
ncbi:MAG TPA: lipopolysaccharide biosynthesis protein [Candidatus Limosilactobacillus merdigallinarum]|uniref:Capsular polysaccharide biosynthesis protein CpsC n=1 Tax=Candidatus Limosilactobacillus merdigallinarum TaxID=2838652 RepID=A0A9D1VIR4_9LACO|nr:lipopolysaccharide biosynthesis protein [Candidatus Limosilactobacillus merdigallinarum]